MLLLYEDQEGKKLQSRQNVRLASLTRDSLARRERPFADWHHKRVTWLPGYVSQQTVRSCLRAYDGRIARWDTRCQKWLLRLSTVAGCPGLLVHQMGDSGQAVDGIN